MFWRRGTERVASDHLRRDKLVGCLPPRRVVHGSSAAPRGSAGRPVRPSNPELAFLEARHVVEQKTVQHAKAITDAATSLSHAASNVRRDDLRELAQALTKAERSYKLENPRTALSEFSAKCQGFAFSDAANEQRILDTLRGDVTLRGYDVVDLYILAAVAANRDADPCPRRRFCR